MTSKQIQEISDEYEHAKEMYKIVYEKVKGLRDRGKENIARECTLNYWDGKREAFNYVLHVIEEG